MLQKLVLMDFDGTITKKDSFIEMIRSFKGQRSFYFGLALLTPVILLYKAGIIKNWRAKEIVFTHFFRNERFEIFKGKCRDFSLSVLPGFIKSGAMEAITQHIKNGDRVIIISASFEVLLTDWCKLMNMEIIGTRIEIRNGLITGKIEGKNCYGIEKVNRLNQYLDITQFSEIWVYGDSKGDMELLELGTRRFYRYFK